MRKQSPVGLIVEGNSTNSTVLRLANIAQQLGPIKSRALQVARRVSNLLRAGYAVARYEDLQAARLVLLRIPDPAVPTVVDELCQSQLVFEDLCFVLCESWLSTDALAPLQARGASVATLLNAPTRSRKTFVVEGQLTAVRQIRRFLHANTARTVELRPGTKPFYFAAALLATTLPLPLFAAAEKALRTSGVSGNHLHVLLNEMAQSMFKSFAKSANVSSGSSPTRYSAETVRTYLDAIARDDPRFAEFVGRVLACEARPSLTAQPREIFWDEGSD